MQIAVTKSLGSPTCLFLLFGLRTRLQPAPIFSSYLRGALENQTPPCASEADSTPHFSGHKSLQLSYSLLYKFYFYLKAFIINH